MTNEAANSDVVLHMGEAIHVLDALKTELISKDVLNKHLGPMGATAVEVWSAKTGQTLTMHHSMGGCSLYIHTPNHNVMMQLSNELAEMKRKCAELESRPLCVKPNDAMREAAPLCVKLPDSSSKAFWSGVGKTEKFHPETYKRWVKEAIERAGDIAGIKVEVK